MSVPSLPISKPVADITDQSQTHLPSSEVVTAPPLDLCSKLPVS